MQGHSLPYLQEALTTEPLLHDRGGKDTDQHERQRLQDDTDENDAEVVQPRSQSMRVVIRPLFPTLVPVQRLRV